MPARVPVDDIQLELFDQPNSTTRPDQPDQTARWLTTSQLAELLGCHPNYIRTRTGNGTWPAHRIGNRRRFSPEDVAAIEIQLRKSP